MKWAADQKLASDPGTEFAYSGCGFDTAVRAVEVACDVRFEDELRKRIFAPLGMNFRRFVLIASFKRKYPRDSI